MQTAILDLQNPLDAATYLDGAVTDADWIQRSSEIFAANGYRPDWFVNLEARRTN